MTLPRGPSAPRAARLVLRSPDLQSTDSTTRSYDAECEPFAAVSVPHRMNLMNCPGESSLRILAFTGWVLERPRTRVLELPSRGLHDTLRGSP